MKLDFDRMAKLAGLQKTSKTKLNESKHEDEGMEEAHVTDYMEEDMEEEDMHMHEDDMSYEGEGMHEEEDADEGDEMIEIDEVMLVQELRRAKKQLQESRTKKNRRNLQEKNLKKIIEQEVRNIFSDPDLNLTADWVYGKNKPKASRKGYTHQGSFLKGIGFE